MNKHIYFSGRATALTVVVALMLALAACTNIPGMPSGGTAATPAGKAGEAAKTGEAPKAGEAAKTAATAAPGAAGKTTAPAAGATAAAPAAAAPAAAPATGATVAPGAAAQPAAPAGAVAAPPGPATGAAQPAQAAKTSATLEGPLWKLQSYSDAQGQTVQVVPNATVTAEFKGGRVTGSGGCNTYFASYKVEGAKLTISQAGSSMKACADEAVMTQEIQFLQLLGKSATHQISGDMLTISDANGKALLTFQATAAPTLTSNPWDVISFNNGKQAVVSVNPAAPMTAVFGADGKLNGSSGCNTYSGSYQVDGNKIKIGQLATTRKACAQPIMEQEAQFLKALQSSATWSIFNGVLGMRTAQDAQSVNFLPGATAAGLAGSSWNLTGINTGNAVEGLPAGVKATIQFGADGQATGSSGCNTFNIPYTADGSSIKFGQGMTTMKACEGPAMQVETQFLKALTTTTKWSVDGNILFLRNAQDAITATFEPAK